MPRVLKEDIAPRRWPRHDWDVILDGTPREYVCGEDFAGQPHSFAVRVRQVARDRGLRAAVRAMHDRVQVQAFTD